LWLFDNGSQFLISPLIGNWLFVPGHIPFIGIWDTSSLKAFERRDRNYFDIAIEVVRDAGGNRVRKLVAQGETI
jgi:hypothetical protein